MQIQRRKNPITEEQLRDKVQAFLLSNFEFVSLDVDKLIDGWIRFRLKDDAEDTTDFEGQYGEILVRTRVFGDWDKLTDSGYNYLCNEFLWQNLLSIGKGRKRSIKLMMQDVLENTSIVKNIPSHPNLVACYAKGRQSVKGIKSLPNDHLKRESIEAEPGDVGYVCVNGSTAASPVMILTKHAQHYTVVCFTHIKDGSERNDLDINAYAFMSLQKYEIGLTPEQAARQRR